MENVLQILNDYTPLIIIGLAAIVLIQFILLIVAFRKVGKIEKKHKKMMRGTNTKNLEEFITSYLDKIDEANATSQKVIDENNRLEEKIKKCVQKTGVVRYKAFENVGSDLSFSVALLDDNNDGVILTGIFGRDHSTTYAKPIDKGISRYDLSEEEKSAINKAMN